MSSIARRDGGGWRARYRDEAGKEHARHFSRKVDAQRWIDETTTAVVTGQYVDPKAGRTTFMSFYREWSARQVWVSGTVKAMDLAARTTTFADIELGKVRRSHVEAWVKSMSAAGLAPGTVKTRVNNVRSVLRAAVRDRIIATDPSENVTLPRGRRAEAAMNLPTAEQVAKILGAAEEWFRPFVSLAAFAGLRLGEAAAIQIGDVDFLRRTLTISRQVQRANGGEIEVRAPKYGSERKVFLAESVLTLLAAHVEHRGNHGDKTGWLFEVTAGNPPHQNTVGYQWRQACKRAAVTDLTLHDLRHFYASGLIAAGCDVVTVQRALGHAKATTTLNTYAHLWPNAEDRTRRATEGLVANVAAFRGADFLRTDQAM